MGHCLCCRSAGDTITRSNQCWHLHNGDCCHMTMFHKLKKCCNFAEKYLAMCICWLTKMILPGIVENIREMSAFYLLKTRKTFYLLVTKCHGHVLSTEGELISPSVDIICLVSQRWLCDQHLSRAINSRLKENHLRPLFNLNNFI